MFKGSLPALVTPFSNGQVDVDALKKLVNWHVDQGSHGLVPVGTTGESPTLTHAEHDLVVETVVNEAAGRIPVIAGAGSNNTAETVRLVQAAKKAGADAALVVTPYYNKPSQEGLFQHFKKIANSTNKPIILYSIPGRCVIDIGVETVARLAEACPNIRTIKEAGGDVARVHALQKACPDVTVLSGDDGLIASFVEAGAQGVISVASNLAPGLIKSYTDDCLAGETEKATAFYQKWEPLLTELVFLDGNPVTIKEALFHAGIIPHPTVRLPLVRTEANNQARIRELLQSINLLSA